MVDYKAGSGKIQNESGPSCNRSMLEGYNSQTEEVLNGQSWEKLSNKINNSCIGL